jgi:mono/diheme cytochrome c family protein
MSSNVKIAIVLAGILIAGISGGVIFVESGIYNIGADDHHTPLVLAAITQLRDRSIAVRSSSIEPRLIDDPQHIASGAQHYATLCAGCHLAPGMTKSDVRVGLYPHPPNLPQEAAQPPQRAFWIIKHGIKMSAMPSWGKTLDDEGIWDVVAFLRKLPDMTVESYQAMTHPNSG